MMELSSNRKSPDRSQSSSDSPIRSGGLPSSGRRENNLTVKITAQMKKTTLARSPSSRSGTSSPDLSLTSIDFDPIDINFHKLTTERGMADEKAAIECLEWIKGQQNEHDQISNQVYSKKQVNDSCIDQRTRSKKVDEFRQTVEKTLRTDINKPQKDEIEKSYKNLQGTSQKQLESFETVSEIVGLEDMFAPLSRAFAEKATSLVTPSSPDNGPNQTNSGSDDTTTASNAQKSILATRNAWEYISQMLHCAEQHLKNAADYHQFFNDAKQYQQWMSSDLSRAQEILRKVKVKRCPQAEDAKKLLSDIQTALSTFSHWRGKLDDLSDRSNKLLPIPLRLQKLKHERPVKCLSNYKTNEINLQSGEELILMDNSNPDQWKVRNMRNTIYFVPSSVLAIPGPTPEANDATLKLWNQFKLNWTNVAKKSGKSLIAFLDKVFRDLTPDEEREFRTLPLNSKQKLNNLLSSIEKLFSPHWEIYPPYKPLSRRMERLQEILKDPGLPSFDENSNHINSIKSDSTKSNILIVNPSPVNDLVEGFQDYWEEWEKCQLLSDLSRPPNGDTQESRELLSQWKKCLLHLEDDPDWMSEWGDMEEVSEDKDEEIYTIETAKETAETSQLTTSEQEERQTFVITGVINPRDGNEISLDSAVSLGIINQSEGKYVLNSKTGESMPIPMAMNAGKIKVEVTTTKKSAEKRSDLGLITIKNYRESRPFTVRAVVDAKTEKQMSVEDAIRLGIMDQKKGIYKNLNTREELSLADALDSGLLVVDFDASDADLKNSEAEAVTKMYAIHAVIDTKTSKRLAFRDAVEAGLLDPETGAYFNKSTSEYVYVGDAIKRGFIKATVVNDPKTLDIVSPGNRINVAGPDHFSDLNFNKSKITTNGINGKH